MKQKSHQQHSEKKVTNGSTKPGYPPNPKVLTPEEYEKAVSKLPESAITEQEKAARQMGLL